jgi:two-component system chemotaxis response regulator CheB
MPHEAIAMGASAGGLRALSSILSALPADFPVPIFIVQHTLASPSDILPDLLDGRCLLTVRQAEEKEAPEAGRVYVAPPDYHLMVEMDRRLSLSVDPPVNYARPSIDVLFETAAEAYGSALVGVVLTGANSDGARGLRKIKDLGGFALVQDPATAEAAVMPQSALEAIRRGCDGLRNEEPRTIHDVDRGVPLEKIGEALIQLCREAGT